MGAIPWYWTLCSVVVFGATLYFGFKLIRDKGNGKFADWLRFVWPKK